MDAGALVQPLQSSSWASPRFHAASDAAAIPAHLVANPTDLALIPAGLVVPTIKALPVDGADLFGNAEARAAPWPFTERVAGPPEGRTPVNRGIRTS